jgi:hypothetical protein
MMYNKWKKKKLNSAESLIGITQQKCSPHKTHPCFFKFFFNCFWQQFSDHIH